MLRLLSTILLFTVFSAQVFAQDTSIKTNKTDSFRQRQTDSTQYDTILKRSEALIKSLQRDSAIDKIKDSLNKDSSKIIAADTAAAHSSIVTIKKDSVIKAVVKHSKPVIKQPGIIGSPRTDVSTDVLFYILVFIIFFLALIKNSFPKYFNSIFSLSFQATFRQTQTREQMAQNFFPAFMLNVLFILSGGLFITLVAQFYKWTVVPFWQLFIYSTIILGIIYSVKYVVILFTGWVFNAPNAAAEYRFIVFLINKLIGILFIPVTFIMAYSSDEIKKITITVALCIAVLLLLLRYLVSLARIRKNLNLTAFHFFIYLCAIEIMPLLVIYKFLFIKTGNT